MALLWFVTLCLIPLTAMSAVWNPELFRSGWVRHWGLEPNYNVSVGPDPALYRPMNMPCKLPWNGAPCIYNAAGPTPDPTDAAWLPATNPSVVGFAERSNLFVIVNGVTKGTCMQYVDFTYFQMFFYITSVYSIHSLTVLFNSIDDGVRLTLFNSRYPFGVVPSGGIQAAGSTALVPDFKAYVVQDELNRIVLTQMDDCYPLTRLLSATLWLDGAVLPAVTCTDGIQNGDETAVDIGGSCNSGTGGMPVPHDCKWGEWGAWTSCSKYCAGGLQSRQRAHLQDAFLGGLRCIGLTQDVRACNTRACPRCGDVINDVEGNSYRTLAIGSQCWMRDNLNSTLTATGAPISARRCGQGGPLPYQDRNVYCSRGAFYTWTAAMAGETGLYPRPTVPQVTGICPGGPMNWRMPSVEDWATLVNGLPNFPAKLLQQQGSHCVNDACYHLGQAGLDAQLLGYISQYDNTTFEEFDVNYHSYFWSSSRQHPFQQGNPGGASDDQVYVLKLRYDHHLVPWVTHSKQDYLAVRCISDAV